ncbi:MAG: M20/M25/M40 family metallo-hydrolase, partial [Chloroflexi bacterium]|nr:M20/M25/M40 family metallo-hydrolase [Chloroflexota bacterium]
QVPTGGFPVIYGEIGGKADKTLSFYDHYDVQPADPLELWESEPFEPQIRNGTFYARGVADNKGNLIARIAAVDAYLRARGELPINVKFIFEGEEEIGSPNLGAFASANRDLIQADGCIWEAGYCDTKGRRQVYLGLKGILYVELRTQQANVDLHSSWAAVVPSAAWHLLRALQALNAADDRVLIPGFYDRVLAPTESDWEVLRQMDFDEEGRRKLLEIDGYVNNLTGDPLLEQFIFQPTCNIAGMWSGYTGDGMKTVLPHTAGAKLDFRLVPDQDPHEIYDLLVKHLADSGFGGVEVKLLAAEHPARTATDHPFAHVVIDAARDVYDHEPVVMPLTPGSGPMYQLCQKFGIPAVSIGVGNEDSRNHAPNENIHVRDFYKGIEHIATIIDRFGTAV